MPFPLVHVWPVATIRGWVPDAAEGVKGYPAVPLLEALEKRWGTDAHICAYRTPDGMDGWLPSQPRIRKAAIATMADRGAEPALHTAWMDLDTRHHKPWDTPSDAIAAVDRAYALLQESELAGGGVYSTRAGIRVLWALEAPVPVRVGDAYLEALTALSASVLDPIAEVRIDPVSAQWGRCFRLPFVMRDGTATTAHYIPPHGPLSWRPAGELRPSDGFHSSQSREHPEAAPSPPSVPPPHLWDALRASKVAEKHLTSLLLGQPIARAGSRNTTMLKVLGAIAGVLRCEDPGTLYGFMHRSILADGTEGAPTLDHLWGAACRIADRQSGANVEAVEDHRAQAGHIHAMAGGPAVVRVGRSFYVRDRADGTYRPPVDSVGLAAELEAYGASGLVIRTKTRTPFSAARIMSDCGVNAQNVIYEMGRADGEYDADAYTMRLPSCPTRSIQPKRSKKVSKWLDLLGGDSAPMLLDWLAALPRLQDPTCALYLQGDPSIGKGLLALSCANLWADAPVPFSEAIGKWTISLKGCPLVHLDEGLTARAMDLNASTAFRSLVGESAHTVTEKYQPNAILKGCVRVLITANSANALPLTGQHSYADMQAVIRRILYIKASKKAGAYLETLGGREGTEGWAEGKVPAHILWLAKNRDFQRGSRFLVEGRESTFHRDLLIMAGINADVLAALSHHIDRVGTKGPNSVGRDYPGIRLPGDGTVLVNTVGLRKRWNVLLGENPPPESALAAALRDLSIGTVRKGSKGSPVLRYYQIPGALVVRASNRLLIGDGDLIWTRLTTPQKRKETPQNAQ